MEEIALSQENCASAVEHTLCMQKAHGSDLDIYSRCEENPCVKPMGPAVSHCWQILSWMDKEYDLGYSSS